MIFVLSCKYEYNKLLLDRDDILNECKCNAKKKQNVDVQYSRFNFGRSGDFMISPQLKSYSFFYHILIK